MTQARTTPSSTLRQEPILDDATRELLELDIDLQRFLLAADAGAGLDIDLLATLLDREPGTVPEVMAAARSTGLLGGDGGLLPIAQQAIRTLIPVERRIGVRQRMLELRIERGGSVLPLARSLLGTGIAGHAVAAAFHAAAKEAVSEDPALSARLCAEAVRAGRPMSLVAAHWARAAALSGDLNRSLQLADSLIAADDVANRAAGAQIAAAALAHRGQLNRSAELYRWSDSGSAAPLAVTGLIGTGQLRHARQLLDATGADAPPTSWDGAVSLMAQGVHESVVGSTTDALSTLARAATLLEPAGHAVLLPDSPAALTALVGLHAGELTLAASVLDRAVATGVGGAPMATRHRLLRAWIAMARGACELAAEQLAATTAAAAGTLELRDWLFAVGLQVGLARRNSDPVTLRRVWPQACEAMLRHPVDLFSFLPLGEFATAAARLGDSARLAPHLAQARSLLDELGNPPLWSTSLHWNCLHAAVIAEQPAVVAEHVEALAESAAHCRYCGIISVAAQRWAELTGGKVDADSVESAAHGLHDVGLWWDGAALAGQAAVRTSDRKAMVSLLNCARLLQGKPTKAATRPDGRQPPVRQDTEPDAVPTAMLSERERDVAALVLDGMTYKQIGDRLFISAKTVEHHMARMRRRLGCQSRAELLAKLAGEHR
ncbi:MAG: helix-turn-helix transcriptional regulator [Sciscionella sp.]